MEEPYKYSVRINDDWVEVDRKGHLCSFIYRPNLNSESEVINIRFFQGEQDGRMERKIQFD